jgi:hypothetical protein
VAWTSASGDFTAAPNTGYILSGPGPARMTLPPSSSLTEGDVVRLSSARMLSWDIVQNEAQVVAAAAGVLGDSDISTTPGSQGGLTGAGESAVELLYVGGDQFRILSREGSIAAH